MLYRLSCFIPNRRNLFCVDIDETNVVQVLKKEIKKEIPNTLAAVAADHLTLYRVAIDNSFDKKKRMNELERSTQRLNECTMLDEERQLSEYFGGSPPPGLKYYVFVQIPTGESCCHLPAAT